MHQWVRQQSTPFECLFYTAELWKNSSEWSWVACYCMSMSKIQHVHGWEWEQPAGVSNLIVHTPSASVLGALISVFQAPTGPSAPSSPSFWSLLCCRFPQTGWITGRADVREKERGNTLKETAGRMRMLTHSLSATILHKHIYMLSLTKILHDYGWRNYTCKLAPGCLKKQNNWIKIFRFIIHKPAPISIHYRKYCHFFF